MSAKKAPKTSPAPSSARQRTSTKAPARPSAARRAPARLPAAQLATADPSGGYYVSFASVRAAISTTRPKGNRASPSFDTFEQARSAAIDALVEAIEAAEADLLALKRARDPADRSS
jgi:hypothetical protein